MKKFKHITVSEEIHKQIKDLTCRMLSYDEVLEFMLAKCGFVDLKACVSDPLETEKLINKLYKNF